MNQLTTSLWGDEAWAATLINKGWGEIIRIVSRDTSPPMYYLTAHAWTRVFGMSEIALRSLSTFYFLLTAIFVGAIAWELFKNKKVVVISVLLALVNPFLFQYAFEARMYAILVFGSTMATYFYLKKWWIPYILAAAFSLYSHHFSLFIIFWHFLWTTANWIQDQKLQIAAFIARSMLHAGQGRASTNKRTIELRFIKTFWPFFGIGLVYLPWLPTMYAQTKLVAGGFWLGKPMSEDLVTLFFKFLSGTTLHSLQVAAIILGILILILRQWGRHKADFFLVGWFLTPILLTYLISQIKTPIFYDRYMLNTIPALILLLSSRWRKLYGETLVAGLILTSLVLSWYFFTHPTKRPFRELATYVQNNLKPTDALINWNGAAHHLFESKYYGLKAPIYTPGGLLPYYTGTALMEPGDQISTLPNAPRLGVITSEDPDSIKLTGYTKTDQKLFTGLTVEWWTKNEKTNKKSH